MKILKICFIILSVLLFGACSHKSINVDIKNKIESIEISSNVIVPKYPFFMLQEDAIANNYYNEKASKRLALYFDRNKIDIKEIYQKELKKSLSTNNYFKDKITKNGKYILISTIQMYGLTFHPNIFNNNYKPIIVLKIDLEDKETKELIWSNSCYISNFNSSTASKPLYEYINNPQAFKKELSELVNIAIIDILNDI